MPAKAAKLSFEQRVECQKVIEKVYWRHRKWPKENPQPKPAFELMMPKTTIIAKTEDIVKKSNALAFFWQRPVTGEQLQAEMERMARSTKDPALLKELWSALGNDPYMIAECLARPILSDRLIRNWYAQDERFHQKITGETPSNINSFEKWWNAIKLQFNKNIEEPNYGYALPTHMNSACNEDTWSSISGPPDPRLLHTAVWTGVEMIVWGGQAGDEALVNSGGKYNPATDTWSDTSLVNAPSAHYAHSAVWTGNEMIIWGGDDFNTVLNSGARYNPVSDSWIPTSTINAPSARWHPTAVWTGTEMIIWGGEGSSGYLNSGGKYNPVTDAWSATSGINVPSVRSGHTAIWTGTEMIIWGGYYYDTSGHYLNSGGRYNPGSNSWSPTSSINTPSVRANHSAVWTNNEMIIWGGSFYSGTYYYLNTGARYDPASDTWIAASTTNAPVGRSGHSAVWSGNLMLIWGGGTPDKTNTGGRYNPATDSWMPTSTSNAPSPRLLQTAVWTGTEMIIWGGNGYSYYSLNSGARYDPLTDSWVPTSMNNAPTPRISHTAVWTGVEMIIWGGMIFPGWTNTGSSYNLALNSWTPTSPINALAARDLHTAIWTGKEMIIWGGVGSDYFNDGSRYNPASDSWTPISMIGTPALRFGHSAVWTGTEMIIWGGQNTINVKLNTGARYNPNSNSWIPTTLVNAPEGRLFFTAIWTNSEMIVWGGNGTGDISLNNGGRYNPISDSWNPVSEINAPSPRYDHLSVWTGTVMIIWGGNAYLNAEDIGGRYNPASDSWSSISTTNAPGFSGQTAVWSGMDMIVWGSYGSIEGGKYNPKTDSWTPTSTSNAPLWRYLHSAVWSDTGMIIWGGVINGPLNSGGFYCTAAPCLISQKPIVDDSSGSNPNGIIEENENVTLRGSLHNICAGTLTSVTGHIATPDAITISTTNALYPDIAPGQTQSCTSCYSLTAPSGNRPASHWDFTVIETPDCDSGCILSSYYFNYHVGNSFSDVPPSSIFYSYIEKIFHSGVTSGCAAHTYCPDKIVNREQMAKFMCTAMDAGNPNSCTLSGCSGIFSDVPSSNMFCSYIEALFNAGVVSGCQSNPLAYCPDNLIQRQAMAKVVCLGMNSAHPGSCVPTSCTGIFNDVTSGNPFCSYIEALYNGGVILGCGPLTYCPAGNVTRAHMAKFLVNGFGFAL